MVGLSARGANDVSLENMQEKTIVGRVKIYGNEPHTFAGIVDANGNEYSVYPDEKEAEIKKLTGNLIEFKVILLTKGAGYGSLFLKGGTVTPISWRIITQKT
jgi:hypothetical protein